MAKSKHMQVIALLEKHGWKRVMSRSEKYKVFQKEDNPDNVYLGRKAGLRMGRTISESVGMWPWPITTIEAELAGGRKKVIDYPDPWIK